ncbi:hypothetical protein L1049_001537 [Liquidambar formosana]|uniref:Uncharacterized protein n=1 Tax=Liquidambar formosana TaxID=63359 RepID=A0AAP0R6A2_LIQFO
MNCAMAKIASIGCFFQQVTRGISGYCASAISDGDRPGNLPLSTADEIRETKRLSSFFQPQYWARKARREFIL